VQVGGFSFDEYSSSDNTIINQYKEFWDNATSSAKSYQETLTKILQYEQDENQLYIDRADAQADLNESKAESATSAKKQNKYLQKEISCLKTSYDYQVKNALLENDVTEATRLRLEYEQKVLDIMSQQLDNITAQSEAQIAYNNAKIENASNKKKTSLYTSNAESYEKQISDYKAYLKSDDYASNLEETTSLAMQVKYSSNSKKYKSIMSLAENAVTDKTFQKIQSCLDSGTKIPKKVIAACEKVNSELAQKLKDYNDAYDTAYSDTDTSMTLETNTKIEEAETNARNERVNAANVAVDTTQAKLDKLTAQYENLTTVSKKNANLTKQISATEENFDAQRNELLAEYTDSNGKIINQEEYKNKLAVINANEEKAIRDFQKQGYQNKADEAQASIDLIDAQNELLTDYKEQNANLDKQKSYINTYYTNLIAIAALEGDVTEQKRLQAEWQSKLADTEKTKFDNIQAYYENQAGLLDNQLKAFDNRIAEIEASGRKVNKAYYEEEKKIVANQSENAKAEKAALLEQLKNITIGTSAWYECQDAIQACDDTISECTQKTYELNDAITQLKLDLFDDIADGISRITDEQEFLRSLFAHEDTVDEDTGDFTEAGLAKLGSLAASYYASKERQDVYKQELEELQNVLANGKQADETYKLGDYSFGSLDELKEQIETTYDNWRSNIQETYDLKSDIADLMTEKYEAELDAVKEIIDARKSELSATKDLHDYTQSVQEKTKSISQLRSQIAAYSGDTSAEALSKLQKLQTQLSEQEQDLQETEYDRMISDQQDMLDKLQEEYEELIETKISEFEKLVSTGLETAEQNTETISSYLESIADENGYSQETKDLFSSNAETIETGMGSVVDAINGKSENSLSNVIKNNVQNAVDEIKAVKTAVSGIVITSGVSSDVSGIQSDSATTQGTGKTASSGTTRTEEQAVYPTGGVLNSVVEVDTTELKKQLAAVEAVYGNSSYYIKGTKSKWSDYATVVNQETFKSNGKVLTTAGLAELRKALGVSTNAQIYPALMNLKSALGNVNIKNVGAFAKGGIVSVDSLNKQIRANGDDALVSVSNGEGILTPVQTAQFDELVKSLPDLNYAANMMKDIVKTPDMSNLVPVNNIGGNNVVQIDTLTLPNVTNYEEFKSQMYRDMQSDKKFENLVKDMSINQLAGGSRLGKYRQSFK
jgi:hypothetical protein